MAKKKVQKVEALTPDIARQLQAWMNCAYPVEDLRRYAQMHAATQIRLNQLVGMGGPHLDIMAWVGDAIQGALTDKLTDKLTSQVVEEIYCLAEADSNI